MLFPAFIACGDQTGWKSRRRSSCQSALMLTGSLALILWEPVKRCQISGRSCLVDSSDEVRLCWGLLVLEEAGAGRLRCLMTGGGGGSRTIGWVSAESIDICMKLAITPISISIDFESSILLLIIWKLYPNSHVTMLNCQCLGLWT